MSTTAPPIAIDPAMRRRALVASSFGSAIEWYDFFLYGTMAGLVFGPLFFPSGDPTVSLILSLSSYALAFAIRPVGGIVFSHIGDRIGRKRTLMVTFSLMGIATIGVGLMPTYSQIGLAAPILLTLLRLIQGLALGGEWGGGMLLAVEYAPKERRGLYGTIPQTGALIGLALGNLAAIGAEAAFGTEAFESFGWRIPFLASIVLIGTGLWMRHRLDETPSFRRVQASGERSGLPIGETVRKHWPAVLIAVGAKFIETCTFFIFANFMLTYALTFGHSRSSILNAIMFAAIIGIAAMLAVGRISDSIGRKPMFIAGTIAMMALAWPILWAVSQGDTLVMTLAIVLAFGLIWPMYGATLGTFFAESFPAKIRYTGISLGYQLGAAIVGGPTPIIAVALLAAYNDSFVPIAIMIIISGAISLVAVSFARDRTGRDLDEATA